MSDARYTGTENLEMMQEAVNYNRALPDLVTTHATNGSRIVDVGAGVARSRSRFNVLEHI